MKKQSRTLKPKIFEYLDYRAFLLDWFAYKKANQSKVSVKELAKKASLTPAYLSMVFNKKRELTLNSAKKLLPHLSLSEQENKFFILLVELVISKSQTQKNKIFEKMKRLKPFREKNENEYILHEYFANWHHIAIREMALLPDFEESPEWIQNKLKTKVSLDEIKKSLKFLKEKGFLIYDKKQRLTPEEKQVESLEEFQRVALGQFHREFLELAKKSIEDTLREERYLLGHALPLDEKNFNRAKEILDQALEKIKSLDPVQDEQDIHYFHFSLFPLTHRSRK